MKMTKTQLEQKIEEKDKLIESLLEDISAEKASYIDLENQIGRLATLINKSDANIVTDGANIVTDGANIVTDGADFMYTTEVDKVEISINKMYVYIYKGANPLLLMLDNKEQLIEQVVAILNKCIIVD